MALRNRARALLRGPEIELESSASPQIAGRARLGRKTKDLVKRIDAGDIAIIDHADLDRIAAEDLVACGVRDWGSGRCSTTATRSWSRTARCAATAPCSPAGG